MELKEALFNTSTDILPKFGFEPVFQGEAEEPQLISVQQVNIITGINGGLRGNVLIGFSKQTALEIASGMIGSKVGNTLDDMVKSALSEFSNMIIGNALGALKSKDVINFSPATIVTGIRLFLLISRNKSTKLSFRKDDQLFNICFSLE